MFKHATCEHRPCWARCRSPAYIVFHSSPWCFSATAALDSRSFLSEDVRAHSLVLVDELGKGTEVHAGTALAGAMLEDLAASGCAGMFATHLHMLLPGRLELDAPGLVFAKMGVAEEEYEGRWRCASH